MLKKKQQYFMKCILSKLHRLMTSRFAQSGFYQIRFSLPGPKSQLPPCGVHMMPVRLLSLLTLSLLVCGYVHAEATLDGMRTGTYVSGPTIDPAELKNRLVLFEYWGVNCPPCLASIPHISELQEKYGREQLVIIANHCQNADEAKAKSVFMGRGGSDQISVINQGDLKGAKVSGIPRCFLFNHEGKLVYDGSPFNLDSALEDAIKQSPGFLVAGRSYGKTQKQSEAIGALSANLSSTLKSLRVLATGDDAEAKEEAAYLLGKVTDYSEKTMQKIALARTEKPLFAYEQSMRMEKLLKGDELGDAYVELVKDLKKDKVFQSELKAANALAGIRAHASKIGFGPDSVKLNPPAANQMAEALKSLIKKYPNTKAATEATQLASQWQL